LRQVLLNLIRNAAEAVQDTAGGVGLIRVAAARGEAGGVVISVCDSGPGIPRDVAGRLFEPFFSTKRLGLGIGLAVCRTIVEAHGGELTAGRAPDDLGGAMFAIALPGLHEGGAA
jgi:C4-dicarboxylate-specific signal transduction histidine kinase